MKNKPSHFTNYPFDSIEQNGERETVARNIMVILSRTGDVFRDLSLEEYIEERKKDTEDNKEISVSEIELFLCMRWYCKNAETAKEFSKAWN